MRRAAARIAGRKLLPSLMRIYLPSYTPRALERVPAMQVIADMYTAMAIKTS